MRPHAYFIILSFCVIVSTNFISAKKYEPNWDSLDKRPLPQWYDDAKFGIFIHWGVFSVPSFESEWFWYYWRSGSIAIKEFMTKNYPPDFTYADFASQFTTEFYDPYAWANLFKKSGAKYIVLTSKHHEGFTNWPSKYSFNWNSMEVGPKKDLVGELAHAIRNRTDLHFGLYHSLFEWFNPVFEMDSKNKYKTQNFVWSKTMPELYEIVNAYKPEIVWSDGSPGPDSYWNSTQFIAWLYNDSPVKDTVVTNDRWGDNNIACNHGDFYTCEDRFIPGKLMNHKWENCMTIDKYSWGYRRNAPIDHYFTIEELIATLAETVCFGGNLLMNIGPSKEGTIHVIFQERLLQMGEWLAINGEAIYKSKPWFHQNDTVTKSLWYTYNTETQAVYAIVFPTYDSEFRIFLGSPILTNSSKIYLLGYKGSNLTWKSGKKGSGIYISIPRNKLKWALVLKLNNVLPSVNKKINNKLIDDKKINELNEGIDHSLKFESSISKENLSNMYHK